MNMRMSALGLALCAGLGTLALPAVSHAGTVGYTAPCAGGNVTSAIINAGHTPVAVASLDAASLAPLDALIINACNLSGYANDVDVDAAVADGMAVIINEWRPNASTNTRLPGAPAISFTLDYEQQVNLATASPITTGPGGTLTNASLDSGFIANPTQTGYTPSALSPDMVALLVTEGNASRSVALGYSHGNGFVSYSALRLDRFLPGGPLDLGGHCTTSNVCGGMQTYLTNLIGWSVAQVRSCEKEGYTGTQLTWCKNICEKGYTGATLDMWIRRWMGRWHDLPYCAREDEEELPPQDV